MKKNKELTLNNDFLNIIVDYKGAEIKSIYSDKYKIEYLWQGDKNSWKRSFPILFPIVGKLKANQYRYKNKLYEMSQHGFARDSFFKVINQGSSNIIMILKANDETLEIYPFDFELQVEYILKKNTLHISYTVRNISSTEDMYYSIGGHPGFNLPFISGTNFNEYNVEFDESKKRKRYFLNEESFLKSEYEILSSNQNKFKLSHELFKNEAIIMDVVKKEESFIITHPNYKHSIEIKMFSTPVMDFWSSYPELGDFVSVEPCWGLADTVDDYGDFKNKPYINKLKANSEKIHEYLMIFN